MTTTLSVCPSINCNTRTSVTAVPVRSLTVTLSEPPRGEMPACSTPVRSIVPIPSVRNACDPFAAMEMLSLALDPLNTTASIPSSPST